MKMVTPTSSGRTIPLSQSGGCAVICAQDDILCQNVVAKAETRAAPQRPVAREPNKHLPVISGRHQTGIEPKDDFEIWHRTAHPPENGMGDILGHVIEMGQPLIVSDAISHPLVSSSRAVRFEGLGSFAGAPLCNKDGDIIGVVYAARRTLHQWTDEEIKRLMCAVDNIEAEDPQPSDDIRLSALV